MRWVSERDFRVGAKMRLFCLPHAGSGAAGFYRWKALLRERGIDVCPVLLPGREMRLSERALTDIRAVVAGLMGENAVMLDVPYAIYGHSMGALLAYEWAQSIARAGLRTPTCLIVSGRNAPQMAYGARLIHELGDEEFLGELERRYEGLSAGLLDDPELRELFLPILRADLTLVERFQFVGGPLLTCPLVALAGMQDASVSVGGLEAWGELTEGWFHCEWLAGGHFFHQGEAQGRLLEMIGERLGNTPS